MKWEKRMVSKKRTKRSQSKYPALDPRLNLKTRYDEIDYDYIDQLNEKEKAWLNNFSKEYTGASFDDSKKRVHKKQKVESEKNVHLRELGDKFLSVIKALNELVDNTNINHSTKTKLKKLTSKLKTNIKKLVKKELVFINDVYKKEAYDRNNSRNRCVMTRARAQGKTIGFHDLPDSYLANDDIEDNLIEKLDLAKKLQDTEENWS